MTSNNPNSEVLLDHKSSLTNLNEAHDEIRNSLVDTAVKFLISPKVLSYDDKSKQKFLEKKGMTKEEIEMAVSQASKLQNKNNAYSEYQITSLPTMPPPAIPRRNSFKRSLQNFANFSIFLSGIAFGLHYIYKHYVGPYLTGRKPKSSEDMIIEIQKSVMSVLQQIHTTLERMERNISEHNDILKELKVSEELIKKSNFPEFEELKTELSTIKSLLISRKNFPATPSIASIPQWQIMSKAADTEETSKEDLTLCVLSDEPHADSSEEKVKKCESLDGICEEKDQEEHS